MSRHARRRISAVLLSWLLLFPWRANASDHFKQEAAGSATAFRAATPYLVTLPEVRRIPEGLVQRSTGTVRRLRAVPSSVIPSTGSPVSIQNGIPVKTSRRNRFSRIAAPLAELVEQHLEGKAAGDIERFADGRGMAVSGGRVRILLRSVTGNSDAIDPARLAALGTEIKRSRSYVIVEAPLDALPALEQVPGVARVEIPHRFQRLASTSEGTALTNALSFITAGAGGHGQSVAVVDVDFANRVEAQLHGELPDLLYYQAFGPQQPGGDSHGTACAEIVHDMAPGAALHLLQIDDILDLENARDYCLARRISVVSMSLGLLAENFCDGTGKACDIVNAARANGILWVTAAGNEADGHWMGPFLDGDGNGWTTFNTNGTERLQVTSPGAGYYLEVTLTWNAFPYTNQDYDLYLFNSAGNIVAVSDFYQDGNDAPVEQIAYPVPWTGGSFYYSVGVRRAFGSGPMDFRIIVNTSMRNAADRVAARSLSTPADAAGAFTVGAIDCRRYDSDFGLETFSSRGPTYDGRIKPDITAPDYTSGYTYGSNGFPGTSAATPHVAGAAALLRSLEPSVSPTALAGLLERFAVDMGTTPGKDTLFGAGRLRLPAWMEESATLQAGLPQGYFLYSSSLPFWSAVAVFSTTAVQRSVALYDSIRATAPIAATAPSTAPVTFVQDFNRTSRPYHLLTTDASTGAVVPYLAQWSCRRMLMPGTAAQEPFRPWEIVRIHDIFLHAGETYRLSVAAAENAVLSLHDSGGQDGFVSTAAGAVASTASAAMAEASFVFNCTRSDYYGVLVQRQTPSDSPGTLRVSVTRESSGMPTGVVVGTVTSAAGGVPLTGIAVDALGPGDVRVGATRSTDDGSYLLVVPTGTWTIRWSAPGYLAESTVTVVSQDAAVHLNAALRLAGPFGISGRLLTTSSAPIANVTVLLSGTSTGSFVSRTNGYYEFGGLVPGSYTVTPETLSYVFSPPSRSYTPLETPQDGQDFTGSLVYYLQGMVRDPAGSPVSGISVSLTGAAERTVVTGTDGKYTFYGLALGNYAVTPSREGWYFEPASYSYTPLIAAQVNQNFTATRIETGVGEVRIIGGERGIVRAGDSVRIIYRPRTTGQVRTRVATLRGRVIWENVQYCVAELQHGATWPGTTSAGEKAPSGIYLVAVNGGGISVVRRVALVR